MHQAKSDMPTFTGKRNHNGSIDVLFKSFDDANKAVFEAMLEAAELEMSLQVCVLVSLYLLLGPFVSSNR